MRSEKPLKHHDIYQIFTPGGSCIHQIPDQSQIRHDTVDSCSLVAYFVMPNFTMSQNPQI